MKVNRQELVVWIDTDNTIIKRVDYSSTLVLDYYGQSYFAEPIYKNIEFIKSLKTRGYYLIVHSNNGYQWAETVCIALGLDSIIDEVYTKPAKVIDDEPVNSWIPYTIDLNK